MRIATWNVNSVLARLPRLVEWLGVVAPDVLCLQELKTADFPLDAVADLGYEVATHSTGRWNGVAILSRVGIADARPGLLDEPGYLPEDAMLEATEPRSLGATCGGVRVWSVYVPNGREPGHPHYKYKLAWLAALRATVEAELPAHPRFAVLGDFNIAPSDADVWDPAAFVGLTHVTPPERERARGAARAGAARRAAAGDEVRHPVHLLGLPRRDVPQEPGHAHRPRLRVRGGGRGRDRRLRRSRCPEGQAAVRSRARRRRLGAAVKVFVAGATGVLGAPLVRALVAAGHEVTGTSRSAARAAAMSAIGATGIVCDALERDAVLRAVEASAPEVVIHQLTSLPARALELRKGSAATNRLRREGTRHLVDAAVAAGARRVIAESIAFLYAPSGPVVLAEDAPVWQTAPEPFGSMLGALGDLESTVLGTDRIEGVVLRYGALYGPGTWYAPDGDMTAQVRKRRLPVVGSGGGLTSFVHVDDAAAATVLALDHGTPGVYNVVDDEPVSFADQLPAFATLLGAKPPRHVPRWVVRLVAGSVAATSVTEQRGASNAKAKRELGWTPRYPTWREGFAAEFAA